MGNAQAYYHHQLMSWSFKNLIIWHVFSHITLSVALGE